MTSDPLDVNARLYRQCGKVLDFLETEEMIDFKARLSALTVIARIQAIFVALRKESKDRPDAGSAVRKYSTAFKAPNAARGRKGATRPEPAPADDDAFSLERLIADTDEDAA